jgi:chaperonin GroEL
LEDIQGRIPRIRVKIDETTCDYDCEKPRERLAKLAGGVALIRVGGTLEVEVRECEDRVEDAMHATRAAAEAIIAAGGTAPLYAVIIVDRPALGCAAELHHASWRRARIGRDIHSVGFSNV